MTRLTDQFCAYEVHQEEVVISPQLGGGNMGLGRIICLAGSAIFLNHFFVPAFVSSCFSYKLTTKLSQPHQPAGILLVKVSKIFHLKNSF